MSEPSPLSLRVLAWAQENTNHGVRGGVQPYGKFRGVEVDAYLHSVGLPVPALPAEEGFPWCASAIYYGYAQSETPSQPSCCPRTGGAIHMGERAPSYALLDGPRPGAVFVLDRGKGRGHVGICEYLGPLPGQVTTVEPDTNGAGSTTGDAWGRHTWEPGDSERGVVVGWFDFGLTANVAA